MRTIDADAMKAEVKSLDAESNNNTYKSAMVDMLRFFIEFIDNQPTIEAEPVRHGRWIEVTKHIDENGTILTDYECSECCAMVKDSDAEEIESERFCYNCGADMREGGADNG